MSFRRTKNSRDVWTDLVRASEPFIETSRLSSALFGSEPRLIRFLSYGTCEEPPVVLRDIGDDQFLSLERVVDVVHPDSQDELSAFAAERLRRFGRYG